MKFRLEHDSKLSPQLFDEHPVWAQYYSPDDIEHIVLEGYERAEVEKALSVTGYSDEYIFPVINHERDTPYMFTMYSCLCILPNEEEHHGYIYVTSYAGINSISVFSNGEYIPLNLSDPEITEEEELELKNNFSTDNIFPLRIKCIQGLKLDKFYNPYEQNG